MAARAASSPPARARLAAEQESLGRCRATRGCLPRLREHKNHPRRRAKRPRRLSLGIVKAGTAGWFFSTSRSTVTRTTTMWPSEQRWRAVRFARSRVGSRYGNLLLANLVVSALTRGRVRMDSPCEMCGSLVARALASAGESSELRPTEMPLADLAYALRRDTGLGRVTSRPRAGNPSSASAKPVGNSGFPVLCWQKKG